MQLVMTVVRASSVRRTWGVVAVLGPQEVLTLHLALEAGDVAVAEVLAQLLHLLQLQQVDAQHLDCLDHLRTATVPLSSKGFTRSWRFTGY